MSNRQEILLTGSGGQGLILASIILANAAVKDEKNVVQTQSYGPEARGGESMAGVIIDIDPIDYPYVSRPTVLLSLNQKSFKKFIPRADDKCLVVIDSSLVKDTGSRPVHSFPITSATKKVIGKEMVANIVALSILNCLAELVPPEALKESVLENTPKGSGELNLEALKLGEGLYHGDYATR